MNYSRVSEEREKLKFEDTNMANFGTELEYKVKKAASEKEPAWEGTRTDIGIKIWRIEKFQVKVWPKDQYSQFFDGDSYIILQTVKDTNSGALVFKAFMWIGEFSSQDEYGTAAYKIVELDDYLDRKATLYRETQGYESEEFLNIFNKRIQILNGGIETGFVHVEKITDYPGRLYHIRRNDQIYRITETKLHHTSLNNDDCFVLDKILKIYIFFGESCSQFEKFKTASFVKDLKDSRVTIKSQNYEIIGLHDQEKEHVKEFWQILGGVPDSILDKEKLAPTTTGIAYTNRIIRYSDSTGTMESTLISEGSLKQTMLDPKDVFIVDSETAIFAWIGNETSKNEKREAFNLANEFIKSAGRPGYLTITVLNQGSESSAFKKLFSG